MTSQIIPLPFVLLYLESVERKGKNYKSLNISRMKTAFLMKKKTLFIVFEGLSFGGKKNLIKIADTSFNVTSGRKDYLTASCIVLSSEEQALPSS